MVVGSLAKSEGFRTIHNERDLLQIEQLRLLCVTQRMLLAKREEHYKADTEGFRTALAGALSFIDRLQHADDGWSAADVQRLEEIRKLVKP